MQPASPAQPISPRDANQPVMMIPMTLLPTIADPPDREALRFGEHALTYRALRDAATAIRPQIHGAGRVAVWAEPVIETGVAIVGTLAAGVPAVPINPKAGERELEHILTDSVPDVVLAAPSARLVPALDVLPRIDVAAHSTGARGRGDPPLVRERPEDPALIVYTSGTTGPPKGVILPQRALVTTLDALAEAWEWTDRDVLVHGLPLFHVHGLVLGMLGPLRRGGSLNHLGAFDVGAVAGALAGSATMLFGVPTMYHRLASAAEEDPAVARALGRARLLVSGSAALSAADHTRIKRATGQRVVERYGMTETLMICSTRADGDRRPGTVGRPLAGVELRLVDDEGQTIETSDGDTVGEIFVRGANLFLGYLNRPDASAEAFDAGWFRTGDMAVREPDGYIRLIGRKSTDLIKSGGFKIGAGEIEAALLEHPGIAEAAVTGEPDADLGERVAAWVVPVEVPPPPDQELIDHVARLLTPHKRPRAIYFVDSLPRNDMGKVMKTALTPDGNRHA